MGMPTAAMEKYARELIVQAGYDLEDYNFAEMTYIECAKLIHELKDELGWD